MKAAIYHDFGGAIALQNVADPELINGGAVLKVLATGLCLSDWHGWKGHDADIKLPHVPGHELVGEIVAIDSSVKTFKTGDRVTLPFVGGCGRCATCSSGNPQVCPQQFQPGFTHWGSFAEYVSIHYAQENLVHLPDSISNTTAASLGCRFATSYRGVVQQGRVREDEWVIIFGCGGVGLSAIMIAVAKGAQVIAIDTKQTALDRARKAGAHHTILSTEARLHLEQLNNLTDGGADLTVDAIGHPQVLKDAIHSLNRRGSHVQIGIMQPDHSLAPVPMDRIIAYELEILGSHGMAAFDYPEMLDIIVNGQLLPELLIDKEISLSDAIHALPSMNDYEGSGVRIITSF